MPEDGPGARIKAQSAQRNGGSGYAVWDVLPQGRVCVVSEIPLHPGVLGPCLRLRGTEHSLPTAQMRNGRLRGGRRPPAHPPPPRPAGGEDPQGFWALCLLLRLLRLDILEADLEARKQEIKATEGPRAVSRPHGCAHVPWAPRQPEVSLNAPNASQNTLRLGRLLSGDQLMPGGGAPRHPLAPAKPRVTATCLSGRW